MEDVEDEPLYLERVCGLDVAKGQVDVCIRIPGGKNPKHRAQEVRTFGTTKRELLSLADWLRVHGVTDVAMEATGDYWKAPFFRLEAEGFDCVLADAKQVKHLPGRPKTDKADCVWLAKNFERGMLAACFVATEEFRTIRLHTRYRRNLTQERTREKQRVEKLLEDALIKLSCVLTDVHGVSGRAIMEALIAGQKNPRTLAELAVGRVRSKVPKLVEALDGADTFQERHAFLLRKMLDRIDRQSADIDDVTAQIDVLLIPYEEQLAQIDSVIGFGRRSAQDLLAECGIDMSRFRTAAHLVSWSGFCPLMKQSAGKLIGRNARTKGNRYIGAVLGESSTAAGRTKTRLGARYRRLAKRRGKPKAQVATGNTQLKIIYCLLSNPGMRYEDLGPDYYETRMHHRRQVRNHVKSLERLGYTVTLDTIPAATRPAEEEVA
ncbi:IS110 family transposase [Nonomuraea sp. NPDC051941]|uniref:IS110 family transposase n=1 Tax=Nonomuraea sp. NPDC051941 TaxID=3364373 RepID=UPI0037CA8450